MDICVGVEVGVLLDPVAGLLVGAVVGAVVGVELGVGVVEGVEVVEAALTVYQCNCLRIILLLLGSFALRKLLLLLVNI